MKVWTCKQGSPEWLHLRLGIPTASDFDKIITAGGKPSSQAEAFRRHLLAEMLYGHPLEQFKSSWMERGSEMEGDACAYYEFTRDVAVGHVGIITDDAGTCGASPDGLVGENGLAEFKAPAPSTHIAYMLWDEVAKDYRVQLQGQLWVSDREWVDICSYHPQLPEVVVRVGRDEAFIEKLAAEMARFNEKLFEERDRLVSRGYELTIPVAQVAAKQKPNEPGAQPAEENQ
jgi:hypothetical protein